MERVTERGLSAKGRPFRHPSTGPTGVPRRVRLAQSAYDALPPGGQILLHEILLDEDKSGPLLAACFSVTMLVYEKGKQYTFTELSNMLENAVFTDCKATHSFGYYSVVTATK